VRPQKKRTKLLPKTKRRRRHKLALWEEPAETDRDLDLEPVEPGDIEPSGFEQGESGLELDH